MNKEHRDIINQLPEDLKRSFWFGYIMDMADELVKWNETLKWFGPVRQLHELESKANEYERLIEMQENDY